MKEYKCEVVSTSKQAEEKMNYMAQCGWEVKAVTERTTALSYDILITFERNRN